MRSEDDRPATRGGSSDNAHDDAAVHVPAAVRSFVRDYEWIHTLIGIFGNTTFFAGSVLFLWESTKPLGVWLFIVGAAGMLVGSVGSAIVQMERRRRPDLVSRS